MKNEDRAIKKLFEVSSQQQGESLGISDEFSAGVTRRVRLANQQKSIGSPGIGEMAWQMLPVFLVVMFVICVWNYYEIAQLQRTRERVFAAAIQSGQVNDSVVLYMLLQDPSARGVE